VSLHSNTITRPAVDVAIHAEFGWRYLTQSGVGLWGNAEAYDLLRRRCTMIPAGDAQTRIFFDAAPLMAALADPVGEIDYGYIVYAMYPRPQWRGSAL
jgi:hypothetical protein